MTKLLDLDKLQSDPIAAARAEAGKDVTTVVGFIRNISKNVISVAQHRDSDVFVEYPREAIVAGFEDEDSSGQVTLLVQSDAKVNVVKPSRANVAFMAPGGGLGHGASCKSDDGTESCACLPGQKCVKGVTFCKCKDATEDVFPGMGSFATLADLPREMAAMSMNVDESTLRRMFGPGELQPDGTIIYKEKCYWRQAWICTPRGCRIIWYKECISYPE